MKIDIEHIADDEPENPTPYWHVQDLILTELTLNASLGLRPGLAIEANVPTRVVRNRVHYLNLARDPYEPPNPDLHHKNETRVGLGDPRIAVHLGHSKTVWSWSSRLGISVPLGETEPNPFELGRLGFGHQHIQFGTGTWDPFVGAGIGRAIGVYTIQMSGFARFTLTENEHDYRAGDRSSFLLRVGRTLGELTSAGVGLNLVHEEPERWNGQIEEEGNLGRTDLLLSLELRRAFASIGALTWTLQVPIASDTTGEQVEIPLVLILHWEN